MPDDVLHLVKRNNGVVMVNFYPQFVSCGPGKVPANATLEMVVDHIEHIGRLVGWEYVGIGSDFDGTSPLTPKTAPLSSVSSWIYTRNWVCPRWSRGRLQIPRPHCGVIKEGGKVNRCCEGNGTEYLEGVEDGGNCEQGDEARRGIANGR